MSPKQTRASQMGQLWLPFPPSTLSVLSRKKQGTGHLARWGAGTWGLQRARPYLVQGCESILVAQIRADLILQEVAYCNRGDRNELSCHTPGVQVFRGAQVRSTLPRPGHKWPCVFILLWDIRNGNEPHRQLRKPFCDSPLLWQQSPELRAWVYPCLLASFLHSFGRRHSHRGL